MENLVHGIHHVTAIAGDAQENLNFYAGLLGMRLVKKSVNQDDPGTYHLFYADGAGSPGTDLTFFPWPGRKAGVLGTGLTVEVSLAVPKGSLPYWQARFDSRDLAYGGVEERFGERTLPFSDPHGLHLALVEIAEERHFVPWEGSPVPPAYQIRGIHGVRLWERRLAPVAALLVQQMGFTPLGVENGWHRYGVAGGGSGKVVEIAELPEQRRGIWRVGTIHHVAWRVKDEAEELALRAAIERAGLQPTPPIDRFWFKSVYFQEPGGAIFELATDGPGFDRDEELAHLGETLVLPPWLEPRRAEIEALLPSLELPGREG